MANIFLDANDSFTQSSTNTNDSIFGRSGGSETVILQGNPTGTTLDGNVEVVQVAGTAASTTLQVNATTGRLELVSGGTVFATFSGGLNQAVNLQFTDGNVTLSQTGANAFTIANPANAANNVTINPTTPQAGGAVTLGSQTSTAGTTTGGGTTTPSTSQTFALTTALDTPTASSSDDTFIAVIDAATPASSTLTAADTVNGLGGNDTLKVTTQGASAAAVNVTGLAAISNVETLEIRAVHTNANAAELDGTNILGMTLVNNNLSTNQVTMTELADTTAIKITGNGAVQNGGTTATYAAAATSGELTVDGGVTAGAIAVNGTGLTSLAFTSSGAANTTGAISTTGTPTAVTINAATSLTTGGLTVGSNAAAQSLTVSGAATNVAAAATAAATGAVVLGALDDDFATVNASGLTAGGISATTGAVTQTITGGQGSDYITTAHVLTTGSVNAGAGTDTLIVGDTTHTATTTLGAKFTGFEILQASDAVVIDVDNITGSTFTGAVLNDAAGTTTISDMTAAMASNVTIAGLAGAATLGIKGATQVGTLNTLNLTVSDGDTTGSEAIAGTGDLTIAGVESIKITAVDDITLASTANISGMTNLTVLGAGDVSITTGAMAATSNLSVDFSGLTAASTFNFAAATANAISFVGGTGIDTVTDSVVNGNVISTGAGNDIITLTANTTGTGATTLNGGTGADTFNVGNVKGNDAADGSLLFTYVAGDSISLAGATKGIGADVTDVIDAIDGTTLAAAAGSQVEFDTDVQATAVTFQAGVVVLGTTTVTNAGDFLVVSDGAATTQIYQDTDGDRIIEAGEFAVSLTGITGGQTVSGEFTVSGGDLLFAAV